MLKNENKLPVIIVVGADKGGVGKTFLTRSLLDYLAANTKAAASGKIRVFDSEPGGAGLKHFHPTAKLVNFDLMSDQAKILDGLTSEMLTVLDCRAGLLSVFLKRFAALGLMNDVKQGRVELVVKHVLGNTIASLSEIADTAAILADGGHHILVKNPARDAHFFAWDKETEKRYFDIIAPADLITLDHMDGAVAELIDKAAMPMRQFINDPSFSDTYRREASRWYENTAAEYTRVGFNNL